MTIDVNTWLGHWPFRPFDITAAPAFSRHLKKEGIDTALVSSPEAVLEPDPGPADARLFKALKRYPHLHPCPVIHPLITGAQELVADYAARGIRAIRLLPNYHAYPLTGDQASGVLNACRKNNLTVLIQMRLEDERAHHPAVRVPGVSADEVIAAAAAHPRLRFIVCCAYFAEAVRLVQETRNVFTDIAFTEKLNTIPSLLAQIPAGRIVFGSHTPFLYTRAAIMKMQDPKIRSRDRERILNLNSRKLSGM